MRVLIEVLDKNKNWVFVTPYNSFSFDERLDEQLDTGTIQIITNSESVSFADFCRVRLTVMDLDGREKMLYFMAFRSLEKRGKGYYVHNLELVEPTRVLMGVIIEGKKITQPIEGSGEQRLTLYDTLKTLLETFGTLEIFEDGVMETPRFFIPAEISKIGSILKATESPEFHWEAGTLLWECLCDIGDVINAIPRLMFSNIEDKYSLTFDLINETEREYEL